MRDLPAAADCDAASLRMQADEMALGRLLGCGGIGCGSIGRRSSSVEWTPGSRLSYGVGCRVVRLPALERMHAPIADMRMLHAHAQVPLVELALRAPTGALSLLSGMG